MSLASCLQLPRRAALRAVALALALLVIAAMPAALARAVVAGDPGQQTATPLVLVVCKVVAASEHLPQQFEIKVGPYEFTPLIELPGPDGEVCERFTFDQPTDVLISETNAAGWNPAYSYQFPGAAPSTPAPLSPDGVTLYLYPAFCGPEKPQSMYHPAGSPDCTVTIVNGGQAATLEDYFSLTKRPVQPVVDNPGDIEFAITLSSTYPLPTPDSLHIDFFDPNVHLSGGPTAVMAACVSPTAFEEGLGTTGSDECKSLTNDVNGLSVSFTVRPMEPPRRLCEDQVIDNTVRVHLLAQAVAGSQYPTVDLVLQSSASVILKGDPALCPKETVTVRVVKTLNVVGFESPGAGWQFTLSGCGVGPLVATTGPDGIAEFPDLPPANGCSYTVTETLQPGWVPQFVSQTVAPSHPGDVATVEFLNIREFNPPCVDPADPRCAPPPPPPPPATPPATPPAPTATPVPPAPIEEGPSTPTQEPPPMSVVEGAVTQPTPLPPSTGTGPAARADLLPLVAAIGLLALGSGLGLFALSRRR